MLKYAHRTTNSPCGEKRENLSPNRWDMAETTRTRIGEVSTTRHHHASRSNQQIRLGRNASNKSLGFIVGNPNLPHCDCKVIASCLDSRHNIWMNDLLVSTEISLRNLPIWICIHRHTEKRISSNRRWPPIISCIWNESQNGQVTSVHFSSWKMCIFLHSSPVASMLRATDRIYGRSGMYFF